MKTLVLALTLFFIPLITQASPVNKKQGAVSFADHYEVLEGRARSKTPIVSEMFSVYCAGCFLWEQQRIQDLKKTLKEKKIAFEQGHADFMGRFGEQATLALAIALHTNNYHQLKQHMFERLHKQRKDWTSDSDFFATLQLAGITKKEFDLYKGSMFVQKTLADWRNLQQSLHAVPAFIVNNKYLIKPQGLKSTDDFVEVIEYLSKLP